MLQTLKKELAEIDERLLALGISYSRLEKLSGVSRTHYCNIRAGRARPRFDTLDKIKKALDKAERKQS